MNKHISLIKYLVQNYEYIHLKENICMQHKLVDMRINMRQLILNNMLITPKRSSTPNTKYLFPSQTKGKATRNKLYIKTLRRSKLSRYSLNRL